MRKNKNLIILIGNIGSGKSTLAKQYAKEKYVIISRDAIRYMLGAGSYVYDLKLEPAVKKSARKMLEYFLRSERNIVCDETNMSRNSRKDIISLAKKYNYKIVAVILPILKRSVCVKRRMKNPHGQFDANLWSKVWSMFNNMYEEPTKKEGIDKIVRMK